MPWPSACKLGHMAKKIQNPLKFLVDNGLLFAINRLVLHQYGVALMVTQKDDGSYGADVALLDARDDPEGWAFEESTLQEGMSKYQLFRAMEAERLRVRAEKLGYIIQPATRGEAEHTGLECETCGAREKRMEVRADPDGAVTVHISECLKPGKAKLALAGMRALLKSVIDQL